MLSNIDDLSKKMKTLLNTINQFQKQIATPYQAKKSNLRNSILIKIPKYLLLTKIIPYLTYRQCQYLSNTCVFIRRTIYSPFGWKIMNQLHSPYQTIVINPAILKRPYFHKSASYSSEAEDHLQDYQDQKFLIKQRAKYKETLWTKYKQHLSLKQKNQVLQQKLRCQKMFLFKLKLQKTFYQKQKDDLQIQNNKFKQKLKKMTNDFLIRDQKISKKIEQVEQQNKKLQNQKQAFACKIKQYQIQIPKASQKAEASKKALKLLKDFVQNKEFEPLQQIQD